jgi:hypothetical protein
MYSHTSNSPVQIVTICLQYIRKFKKDIFSVYVQADGGTALWNQLVEPS